MPFISFSRLTALIARGAAGEGVTPEQEATLEHFRYDPVTNRLVGDREIQTLLDTFFLGNQWSISSAARKWSFEDLTKGINWESAAGGLFDHSIEANRLTSVGVVQPEAAQYGDFVDEDFLGPPGVVNIDSGSGGPWPADQEIVGVTVRLGENLNAIDWVSYSVQDGAVDGGTILFRESRPVTDLNATLDGEDLQWWVRPTLRAEQGDEYFGIFRVHAGGQDGASRPMILKNSSVVPSIPWGSGQVRELEVVKFIPNPEAKAVFWSLVGDDANFGTRVIEPLVTLATAVTQAEAITPVAGDPAGVIGIGAGTVTEDLVITEDLIVDLRDHTLVGNITVASGKTLYISLRDHTGTITNNGTIIGRIGSDTYGDQEIIDGSLGLGTTPDASAILHVQSASKGILGPRMTDAEADNIASPADGLQITNITDDALNVFFGGSKEAISTHPTDQENIHTGSSIPGTNETLAQTLANGNTTGGNNIVITDGDVIVGAFGTAGAPIIITGGFGDTGGGPIIITSGLTDTGPGADWTRTAGPGGTEGGNGPGGDIIDISGSGNSNNQPSGDLHYFSGNPDGSGAFGDMFLMEDGGNVVIGKIGTTGVLLTVGKDSSNGATNIISAIINQDTTNNNWAEIDFKGVDSAASIFTAARTGVQIIDHNAATKSADYVIKTTHNNILSERLRISDGVVIIPTDLDIQASGPTVTVRNTADFGRSDLDLYGSRNAGAGNAELGSVSIFNTRSGSDVMVARLAFVNGASGTSAGGIQLLTKENADAGLSVRVFVTDAGRVIINGQDASRVATDTVEIFDTSDFDALATGGVITVDGVSLSIIFKDSITSTNRFNVINGGRLTLRFDAAWTYSGTETVLTCATGGTLNIKDGAILGNSLATLFDVAAGSTVTFSNMTVLFFGEYGAIRETANVLMSGNGFFLGNGSLSLIDNASTAISSWGLSSATAVSGALVRVSGAKTQFFDWSASNIALQSGESFIRFDPDAPVLQATLDKIRAVGGELFDTTGGIQEDFTAVADASIGATAVSVTDSGGFARFSFTGPTVYVKQRVITSTFTTNPDYNDTFIIPATDGTTFFDSKIPYGSDESGSFLSKSITLTITATTLSNGDTGVIDTDLSTDYFGGTTFYNKLTNSVQANIPEDKDFTTTHTGSVNTAGIDQKDPRVLARDNPGFADSEIVAFGSMNANTNTTEAIDGTYVALDVTGFTDNAITERFKLIDAVACIYEFTGNEPCSCFVTAFIWATKTGSTGDYRFSLSINGAEPVFASADYSPMEVKTTKVQSAAEDVTQLVKGDTIQWMVAGDGTGDDPTITDFKMRIK